MTLGDEPLELVQIVLVDILEFDPAIAPDIRGRRNAFTLTKTIKVLFITLEPDRPAGVVDIEENEHLGLHAEDEVVAPLDVLGRCGHLSAVQDEAGFE